MGIVYLAFDPELDRNVALKLVLPRRQARQDDPEALVAEARALARLSHPNVIQVYDVGRWGDRVYVALEYVAGSTLDAWLRARTRSWHEILEALLAAGRGIAAAHRAGMVHLDIKPSNILIGDDGVVRVLDFGLARSAVVPSVEPSTVSGDGGPVRVVGTVGYIAPEQFLGHAPDARSDQFGFAVTAWEALTATRPFPGRTRAEFERALFDTDPSSTLGGAVKRILAVLRVGFALRPSSRYADMDELLRALQAAASVWTRRRKWLAAAALTAAVGASGAWALREPASPCPREDPLAEVWHEARSAGIAGAFASTGLPYAGTAWAAARRAMDDRAETWRRVHHEACVATRIDGTRPPAAHARALACLDARRGELDALAVQFERADPGVVESAAAAARALPTATICVDEASDPARADADDPQLAAELTARLAEAWALAEASRLEAATDIVDRVVDEAGRAGLAVIEARGHLLAGHAAYRLGRVADARTLLERGVRTADAAGADDDRITGLIELVYVVGHLAGEGQRAHWYARLCRAVLDRLGGRSSQLANLLLAQGAVFSGEGRHDDALATYRQGLAAWQSAGGPPDETLAALFNNIGSVHVSRGENTIALAWFVPGYLLRVSLAGPEHPAVADVLVNLANAMLQLGKPELALEHNRWALSLLENARGRDDPAARVVLNNIAAILLDLGRYDEAREYAERALRLWRALDVDNPMAGVAMTNLAEADLLRGDAAAALAGYMRAYELLARVQPADHPYTSNALAGIARAKLELGDTATAVSILRHVIDVLDAGEAPTELRAEPRFALARALARRGGEPALVLGLARQARRGYAELGAHGDGKRAVIEAWMRRWIDRGGGAADGSLTPASPP